jgi:hypothetical protein
MEVTEDSECLTKNQKICKVLGTIRIDIKEIKSTLNFLLNKSSTYISNSNSTSSKIIDWEREKKFG